MTDIIIAGPAGGKGIPDVKFAHKNNATQRLLVALDEGIFKFIKCKLILNLDAPTYLHLFAIAKIAMPDDSWKVNFL